MKYMDPKLLLRANDTVSAAKQKALLAVHQKQSEDYERSLPALKHRLSSKAWEYFSKPRRQWPLWDSDLVSFTLGDDPDLAGTPFRFKGPTAEIKFVDFGWDYLYTLRYKGLGEVTCRMPRGYTQLTYLLKDGRHVMEQCSPKFGCLFLEELTSVDEKLLRHEFFFRSRSTISVEFSKVIIERRAINRKER